MDKLRRHRALTAIARIRNAEQAIARQALFETDAREREAISDRAAADAQLDAADRAWHEQLSAGFEPELARMRAGQLIACASAAAAADAHARRMENEREARTASLRATDAHCRRDAQSLGESRRAIARSREERALEAVADRASFAWSRR